MCLANRKVIFKLEKNMLTVQSRINQSSFGERRMSREEIEARRQRAEILRQKEELEALAHDSDAPSFTKKAFNVGAVALGGVAVGLTAGCGTRILIDKGKAFKNSEFMKGVDKYAKSFKTFIKDSYKSVKANFKKTDIYKKSSKFTNEKYTKFKTSKFGEPIVKFVKKVRDLFKQGIEKLKECKKWVCDKIHSVKQEKYESAAVGTVGASSGACAAFNSVKEGQEAGE